MDTISAIIITLNEEENIGECLESISWCDEIVVVDSMSTDRTAEICKKYTGKIFIEPWHGYAKQKNIALSKTSGKWILWVDADERISGELSAEIKQKVLSGSSQYSGYRIPRRFYFMGRMLRFGGVGTDYPLRLFLRDKARFNEEKLVHEKVDLHGKTGRLKSHMVHYSYRNIKDYIQRFNRYTTLAAQELHGSGKRFHYYCFLKPFWELFSRLFIRMAVLDGAAGIAFACLSSAYVFVKYVKLYEISKM